MSQQKGYYDGPCNRTACQVPGARHVSLFVENHFYCERCADMINRANRAHASEYFSTPFGITDTDGLADQTVIGWRAAHDDFMVYVWDAGKKWVDLRRTTVPQQNGTTFKTEAA